MNVWQSFIFVILGSGIGGGFRFLIGHFFEKMDEEGLRHYIPIFIVNFIGSLCIGIAFAFVEKLNVNQKVSLFLITGFLGGFTTYSSFSLDLLRLIQKGQIVTALTYVVATLLLCTLAVFGGYYIMK